MKLTTLFFLLIFSEVISAQSYLSLLIGYDASKIKEIKDDKLFEVYSKPYSTQSLQAGLRYDHVLSKKVFFSLSSTVAQYKASTYDFSFIPDTSMVFYQVKNSLNVNYNIIKHWYLGVGLTHSYIPEVKAKDILNDIEYKNFNRHQIGYNFSTGFTYKRFLLELVYVKGKKNLTDYNYFLPIDNLSIHSGIMFQLPSIFKKKEVKCPRF